jgi:prepilin-type N-terminal cleavage/methylation domain-containing protein
MKRRGFTLLELLVVLAVLAITAAAATPALLGARIMSPEQRTATSLAEALMHARDAARTRGISATLTLAPQDGRYWIVAGDSSETGAIPLDGGVRFTGAVQERVNCRFDASGPATACRITVHGAHDVSVRVDAWSGEIKVDDDRAS